MSEPLPCVKHVQPWTTKPKGPFLIVVTPHHIQTGFKTLQQAVNEFARLAMPADPDMEAHITDHHGVVVLGYLHRPDILWCGVERAFEALAAAPAVHPLEVIMAEIDARDRCPS